MQEIQLHNFFCGHKCFSTEWQENEPAVWGPCAYRWAPLGGLCVPVSMFKSAPMLSWQETGACLYVPLCRRNFNPLSHILSLQGTLVGAVRVFEELLATLHHDAVKRLLMSKRCCHTSPPPTPFLWFNIFVRLKVLLCLEMCTLPWQTLFEMSVLILLKSSEKWLHDPS